MSTTSTPRKRRAVTAATSNQSDSKEKKDEIKSWNATFKMAKGQIQSFSCILRDIFEPFRAHWRLYMMSQINVYLAKLGQHDKDKVMDLAREYLLAIEIVCFLKTYSQAFPDVETSSIQFSVQSPVEQLNPFAYENMMLLLHRVLKKHGNIMQLCFDYKDNFFQLFSELESLDLAQNQPLKNSGVDSNGVAKGPTVLIDEVHCEKIKAHLSEIIRKLSNVFCKHCGSKNKISMLTRQVRSADESADVYISCFENSCKSFEPWRYD